MPSDPSRGSDAGIPRIGPRSHGWPARAGRAIRREITRHPFAWGTVLAFTVLGPILVRMIFPEAPIAVGVVGGVVFGVYAAVSAVPDKFLG